jgi:hypothetical protein
LSTLKSSPSSVRVTFPLGEGQTYDVIKIDNNDVIEIKIKKLAPGQIDARAKVEVIGIPEGDWRFFYRSDLWQGSLQSEHIISGWDEPKSEVPRMLFMEFIGIPTKTTGGTFYCVLLKEKYNYAVAVFVLTPVK